MRRVKKILFFLSGSLATFILVDLFLSYSGAVSKSNSEYYDDIGKGLRKHYTYTTFTEGFSITKVNGLRYLGPEYSYQRKDSTLRIALLGDSYLTTHHVFDRHHVRSVIEQSLERKGIKVEVLNFGRPSFNLGNTYAYFEKFVKKFDPDLTLFFITHNNLTIDSYDPLYVKTIQDGAQLKIDLGGEYYNQKVSFMHFLLQHSSVFSMLNSAGRKVKSNGLLLTFLEKNRTFSSDEYSAEHFNVPSEIFQILERLNSGNEILIWRENVSPPVQLLKYVKTQSIDLIDISSLLRAEALRGNDPNYWKVTNQYGHWNHHGNKIVGEEIAIQIEKRLQGANEFKSE